MHCLETRGINAQLVFASEKDKATRSMLKHNFNIETTQVSHDIMERDNSTLPLVEVCTAGPPCQSMSLEGERGSR